MMIRPFEILGKTKAFFVGPPLEEGPFPTLIYFALSAEDSLQCDPFNQPVQFLEGLPLRIFSITLPGAEHPVLRPRRHDDSDPRVGEPALRYLPVAQS